MKADRNYRNYRHSNITVMMVMTALVVVGTPDRLVKLVDS